MLTIMHVTVSLCGIELDGLQEVPLRFCFLPLRKDRLNTVSLLFQLLLKTTHYKNTTLGSRAKIPLCVPHVPLQTADLL